MMADALPTMTMTCTMASHDEIRADDPRWDAETIGAERWDTGEEILALANCRHCGSTLARVAWRHAWARRVDDGFRRQSACAPPIRRK